MRFFIHSYYDSTAWELILKEVMGDETMLSPSTNDAPKVR